VVPAALVARRRVDLAEGGPQPERAVADPQQRLVEATLAQVAQDVGPGVGALAIAEGHPEQLLAPIRTRADDHEQARVLGFQAGTEVDAVGPQVGEGALDRPVAEGAIVGLPVGLEPQDRRARQSGPFAEEPAEGGLEVARAQALEVQPGEQPLGVLGEVAAPGQEARGNGSAPGGRSEILGGWTSTDQVPMPISRARPWPLRYPVSRPPGA
jgi:hypothetical protein